MKKLFAKTYCDVDSVCFPVFFVYFCLHTLDNDNRKADRRPVQPEEGRHLPGIYPRLLPWGSEARPHVDNLLLR